MIVQASFEKKAQLLLRGVQFYSWSFFFERTLSKIADIILIKREGVYQGLGPKREKIVQKLAIYLLLKICDSSQILWHNVDTVTHCIWQK
jgi:hypothetical protein